MKRTLSILIVLALALAACGTGETGVTVTTANETQTTEAPVEPSEATTETESTPAATEGANEDPSDVSSGVDGPAAPDFTLALGDGSSFTLSDTDRPVYLVFWAEW